MPLSPFVSAALHSPARARAVRARATLHLFGAGKVGRAFLASFDARRFRLTGATDRSGTTFDERGLDPAALIDLKSRGGGFAELPRSARVPLPVLLQLAPCDAVIDCTDSDLQQSGDAVARARVVLASGARLVLAAKSALFAATAELVAAARAGQAGINAALGGTGREFIRDLALLERECVEIAAVPNATTTEIFCAIERGAEFAGGLARARARGLLEADPASDLDGSDAALKLAIVARAVFGRDLPDPDLPALGREHFETCTQAALIFPGRSSRLVARANRSRQRVWVESLPGASSLAAPPGHVVYEYTLASGARIVHIGRGVGAAGTARAIAEDLDAFFPSEEPSDARA